MANINYWLERKYSNLENQSESDRIRAMADQSRAATAMQDAASMAGLRGAQSAYTGEQTKYFGPTAEADIGVKRSQATSNYASARSANTLTDATQDFIKRNPGGLPGLFGVNEGQQTSGYNAALDEAKRRALGLKKGTSKVVDKSGNGSPYKDTVPAKLAEGEAVLNAGAAKLIGRGNIADINKKGLRYMGLPENSAMGGFNVSTGNINAVTGLEYVTADPEMLRQAGTSARASSAGSGPLAQALRSQVGGDVAAIRGAVGKTTGMAKAIATSPAVGKVAGTAAKYARPAAIAYEVGDTALDIANPDLDPKLKAARVAEAGGRYAAMTAGGVLGALVGGPAAPLTIPAGAALGYMSPEAVNFVGRLAGKKDDVINIPSEQIAAINAEKRAGLRQPEVPQQAPETALEIAERNANVLMRKKQEFDEYNKAAAYKNSLVNLAVAGSTGAQRILSDMAAAERSREQSGLKGGAKGTIFAPATDKDGNTVMKEDAYQSKIFNDMFLPEYARSIGIPAEKLNKQQVRDAEVNFNLMQSANRAGRESGQGFQFNSPIMDDQIQYVPNLPVNFTGARGTNTAWQGLRDNLWGPSGGIVVRNAGGEEQTVPMEYLNMSDPEIYRRVKPLMNPNDK